MNLPNFVFGILFLSLTGFAQSNSNNSETIVRFESGVSRQQAEHLIKESGNEIVKEIPELNMYVVKNAGISISQYNALATKKEVLYTEKNGKIKAFAAPNDKAYADQWHHSRIGSESAWNVTTGSYDVVVAVSDTGIALRHDDLKNQLWTNSKEIPNNGIDDDNNGYIDDIYGWNFSRDNNNPDDDNDHGTHCAGIIGAETNNGIGVAGVAWKVKLMAVKFLDREGSGDTDDAIKTIIYAVDNGANIISASWGSSDKSKALSDAIEYAGKKNVLVVAAAGNNSFSNDTNDSFPANYDLDNLISVGASTSSNGKASFSNHGALSVHVAAPGQDIYSSVKGNRYESLSGTSMATPVVSGVAALVLSLNPKMNVKALRNAIFNAVLPASAWEKNAATGGIIQSHLAVLQMNAGAQLWPKKIRLAPGKSFEMTAYQINQPTWSVTNPQVLNVSADGIVQTVGEGTAQVTATDGSGNTYSSIIEVQQKPPAGGCSRSAAQTTEANKAGISFLMLLPFIFAVGFRLRRRK